MTVILPVHPLSSGGSSERTNWRDKEFSNWHQKLPRELAMTDVDRIWTLYNWSEPMALIELKKKHPKTHEDNQSITALYRLADRASLPFFLVFYGFTTTGVLPDGEPRRQPHFFVDPRNSLSRLYVAQKRPMSELEFILLEYEVRKMSPPDHVYGGRLRTVPHGWGD